MAHPAYALSVLWREVTLRDEQFLAQITGADVRSLRRFLNEPLADEELSVRLTECLTAINEGKSLHTTEPFGKKVLLPYCIVRALRPQQVVETGVANGVSSALILLALEKNGQGRLRSIDLGDTSGLPVHRAVGWVVPERLRPHWTLELGDARHLLPVVLQEAGQIDVFYHDSLHTEEHMTFEFETAYPFLRSGGVLIADDAEWNPAFERFAQRHRVKQAMVSHGVGILRKAP